MKKNLIMVSLTMALTLNAFAELPLVIPSELQTAGAPSFSIPTIYERRLTKDELNAAQQENRLVEFLNGVMQNNTLILLPPGTYTLPKVLMISGKTNVVLRGSLDASGHPATILVFPNSLTTIYGNNTKTYGSYGAWHGGGGFITVGKKHPLYSDGQNLSSQSIGIENIKMVFNRKSYIRSRDAGFNAIFFNFAVDSYARNIDIENADNAFIVANSLHTSVQDVQIDAQRDGHFGAVIFGGKLNRIENLISVSGMSHQLSVQKTTLNVMKDCKTSRGAGDSLSFRGGASVNLFWNLNVGSPLLGASNGQDKRSPQTYGQQEFFWNCQQNDRPFTQSRVPAFLNGWVYAYYGPDQDPFAN